MRQLVLRDGELYVVTGPAFIGGQIDSLKGRVMVPTHLWKIVYRPAKGQAGAYLITNDETRTYKSLSVTELERMIGIQLLPGVAQRIRDTAMTLPAPSRESGSRPRNNAPAAGTRDDDFGFMDFVRRTVDTILRKLLS